MLKRHVILLPSKIPDLLNTLCQIIVAVSYSSFISVTPHRPRYFSLRSPFCWNNYFLRSWSEGKTKGRANIFALTGCGFLPAP